MGNPHRIHFQKVQDWRDSRGRVIPEGVKVRVGNHYGVVPLDAFVAESLRFVRTN